jgi:hypothetical protein
MFDGPSLVMGFLICAVIWGFWQIGGGLLNYAQMKKRRSSLAIVRDSEQKTDAS